jgi:membrane protease YdiL (CAAX protease family)
MKTEPTKIAPDMPGREGTGNLGDCIAAVVEVVLAFALVHVSYRAFKRFTELGHLEGESGVNFSPGAAMILFTVTVLLLCGRGFKEYGLTLQEWGYNLNVGLVWGVLLIVAAGLVVKFTPVRFDPLSPPDRTRALAAAGGQLVATLLLAWFLLRPRTVIRRIPPIVAVVLLVGLLSLPLALAFYSGRPLLGVLLTILWLFLGAGFGEEIFFRGYVQSRVNSAFGRLFRFMEIDFGLGLIVSSLLFGFIHVLNPVDYFAGRFDFAWWWGVTNFFAGIFFGCLRERTGSVLAGAIVHGLGGVLAMLPGLLP